MKPLAFAVLVVALPSLTLAADKTDPPKEIIDGVKVVTDQLEKQWGVKVKSVAFVDKPGATANIKITLEFTRDADDVKAVRTAFAGTTATVTNFETHPITFYLFDEDNVSIGKYAIWATEGDITGVKGDGFRIYLYIGPEMLKKAKKLEARTPTKPK